MKNLRLFATCLAVLATFCLSCSAKKTTEAVITSVDYSDTAYWYSCGDTTQAADVFYVYPTVSTLSFADNDSSWFADISLAEARNAVFALQRQLGIEQNGAIGPVEWSRIITRGNNL